MEKRAVIQEGITPPEEQVESLKEANERIDKELEIERLEDHLTKRAADKFEKHIQPK